MQATGRKLLTVAEAAAELGLRPKTLRQKIWMRQIEYCKIGGAVRIPLSVIDRIIAESTVPSRPAA